MGTTSFFAALSGLSSNRQAIDVIGNNLANLNTIGFKKSFVTFADIFSASLATSVNGAGNAMEIGLGSRVAGIDQIFSQGSIRSTGSATDMAIQGAGFFVVEGNDGPAYTRAGKFSFNKDGAVVAPNGKFLLGYPTDDVGNILSSQPLSPINVNTQTTSNPSATTSIFMSTLLDADAVPDSETGEFSSPMRVFDSLGVPHTVNFVFRRVDPAAAGAVQWAFDIRMDASEVRNVGTGLPEGTAGQEFSILSGAIVNDNDSIAGGDFGVGRLNFDAQGVLQGVDLTGAAATQDTANILFDLATGLDPQGIKIPHSDAGTFTLSSGAEMLSIDWDVYNVDGTTNIVSYASDAGSATSAINQDGYGVGVLNSIVISPDGILTGVFSNGDVRNLAQVALANFNNPQGLIASGDNEFRQAPGSGLPSLGAPQSGGRGSISGSTLEMSNVDLADEFTSLIIHERGFQANSRVITTNDKMLQEAINLSR